MLVHLITPVVHDFNMNCIYRQYALTGRYRRLIVLPNDLKWQLYMYSDYTKQLTQSDLDLIQEKPEPTSDPGIRGFVVHVFSCDLRSLVIRYYNMQSSKLFKQTSKSLEYFAIFLFICVIYSQDNT